MVQKKSRRQFLRGLATLGAGAALAGCQQVVTVEKRIVETVEVEKVVQVEKEVVQTVEVEKVVQVEKEVVQTVIVEKVVEKVVTATPAPVTPETVTVKFMIWGGTKEQEAWRARQDGFGDHFPHINVAVMIPPGSNAGRRRAILARLTSSMTWVSCFTSTSGLSPSSRTTTGSIRRA